MKRVLSLAVLCSVGTSLSSCGAPVEIDDISYDDRYEETKFDLYLPDGEGPRPTVMLIFPGAWRYGGRWIMAATARRLASSGYTVVNVGYRLVPDVVFPGPVQDAWCALSFVRAHAAEYRVDPDRIAVMGYSAGGHTAAMLGTHPDDPSLDPDCTSRKTFPPRAVIAGGAVLDMRSYGDTGVITDYMGGTDVEKPAAYDLASPLRHVRPGLPRFLFVVGGGDWWVGEDDSQTMRDQLRALGNDSRLLKVGGGGHILNPVANGVYAWTLATEVPEAWIPIQSFLARTIGKP